MFPGHTIVSLEATVSPKKTFSFTPENASEGTNEVVWRAVPSTQKFTVTLQVDTPTAPKEVFDVASSMVFVDEIPFLLGDMALDSNTAVPIAKAAFAMKFQPPLSLETEDIALDINDAGPRSDRSMIDVCRTCP
jgi:hypothetical protein